jgi:hypothetical protein
MRNEPGVKNSDFEATTNKVIAFWSDREVEGTAPGEWAVEGDVELNRRRLHRWDDASLAGPAMHWNPPGLVGDSTIPIVRVFLLRPSITTKLEGAAPLCKGMVVGPAFKDQNTSFESSVIQVVKSCNTTHWCEGGRFSWQQ